MIESSAIYERQQVPRNPLSRPVVIIIPTFGAADKLATCIRSLLEHAPQQACIHVVDDCTPGDSISEVCERADPTGSRINYNRRPENRGFVETCNWAFGNLRSPGTDLLLLNSDTEVTDGFLTEMQTVLDADEKHAAVCPRSNNATLFSVPPIGRRLDPQDAYLAWTRIHKSLRRFHVTPTAVGFCVLIKSAVLDFFGNLFDPIYSPGYNEENDFICRINKFGYSAVAANWAFVFHYESASFSTRRRGLEARNRGILNERYPEYTRKVQEYFEYHIDPLEYFAGLQVQHRPRLLVDLSHIAAAYNGTSEYGLHLLRELRALRRSEYELYIGLQPGPGADFFARELRGYRTFEFGSSTEEVFDLVFKPSQFFSWQEFQQFNRLAPRVAFTLQDIIGVRCEYLNSAYRRQLFLVTAELSDLIFTISRYSQHDFWSFYGCELPMTVIHHGTDMGLVPAERQGGDYILVVGNSYAHKAVAEALEHLGNDLPIMVLGGSDACPVRPNITRFPSGHISKQRMRSLYANARVIVYPSHYEGFGLPVIDALALGKPVVAADAEINRELASTLNSEMFYLVDTYRELLPTIARASSRSGQQPLAKVRPWSEVAKDYDAALRGALNTDVDLSRLRSRWDLVATVSAVSAPPEPNHSGTRPPLTRRIVGRVRRELKRLATNRRNPQG